MKMGDKNGTIIAANKILYIKKAGITSERLGYQITRIVFMGNYTIDLLYSTEALQDREYLEISKLIDKS